MSNQLSEQTVSPRGKSRSEQIVTRKISEIIIDPAINTREVDSDIVVEYKDAIEGYGAKWQESWNELPPHHREQPSLERLSYNLCRTACFWRYLDNPMRRRGRNRTGGILPRHPYQRPARQTPNQRRERNRSQAVAGR